jgi:hypothetical protein
MTKKTKIFETIRAIDDSNDEGKNMQIKSLSAAAGSPASHRLAAQAINMLRHAGVDVDVNAVIDANDLSAKLKANGLSVESRMHIKCALHQIGCLS